MPLHKFPNGAEGLIDFYTEYDQSKPTIAILPPSMGYASIYQDYIKDPELSRQFNIIGLEPSCSLGPTKAVADSRYDLFVAASEMAFMLNAFKVPPVHIFAPETHSPHFTFCLIAAFPERVASLTVLGGSSIKETLGGVFWDTAPGHLNPWDAEGWVEVVHAVASLHYGQEHDTIPCETLDALVDADARTCIKSPESLYMFWRPLLERDWAADRVLPQIPCNILFVQHEVDTQVDGPELAEECLRLLPPHKREVHYVEDATPGVALARPAEVLPVFKDFLQRQPQETCFTASDNSKALQRLSDLFSSKGVDFKGRNPDDPLSFSTSTPALVAEVGEHLAQLSKDHLERKDTPCLLPYGQGPEPWSHSADELSARFSHRYALEDDEHIHRATLDDVAVSLQREEGSWRWEGSVRSK